MKEILVADSGGTKTDWVYLHKNEATYFSGSGLHPAYLSADEISGEIQNLISEPPSHIYFYGAGCHGPEPVLKIQRSIQQVFPDASVDVKDDLTGVARAHLQSSGGLIAALGTGSICGRYDAGEIQERSAALGYAIGDEGSAADLGRTLLKSYFRKMMHQETINQVAGRLNHISYSECMDTIYSSDRPNRELASVAGKVFIQPLIPELREIVQSRFMEFIESQFETLKPGNEEQVVCTGTVAVAHAEILKEAFALSGYHRVRVRENVIKGLAKYHQTV